MSTITNDTEFREALNALSEDRQRVVGALFVENAINLNDDERVARALAAARDPEISDEVMTMVRHAIKAASLEAHARCGSDGKWIDQASYFIARGAEACVEPTVLSKGKGPAWKAAMSVRMAKTCLAAESDEDTHDSESHAQYQILTSYLDS
jgi:hypothetical protein